MFTSSAEAVGFHNQYQVAKTICAGDMGLMSDLFVALKTHFPTTNVAIGREGDHAVIRVIGDDKQVRAYALGYMDGLRSNRIS